MASVPRDEARRRGSKLLLQIAQACRDELDPRPIGRVAFFLDPPPRRPRPDELFADGDELHQAIAAEIESAFAPPSLDDLSYVRALFDRYLVSADREGDIAGAEAVDLPYYRECLAYLDEAIAAHEN